MRIQRIILWLSAAGLTGCLFNGEQTEGLPCNADEECGVGLQCVERVCCRGSSCSADTLAESETEEDSDGTDESGELEPGASDESVREVCQDSDTMCVADDVLQYCSDEGKLSTRGCQGICGETQRTLGCHHVTDDDEDSCICGFDIEPCSSNGAAQCSGSDIRACDGSWEYYDCDDVCVDGGYGGSVYCSDATCYCDNSCTQGALRCTDEGTLSQCSGGSWYGQSCTEICANDGKASLGCHFIPGDDSYCLCI